MYFKFIMLGIPAASIVVFFLIYQINIFPSLEISLATGEKIAAESTVNLQTDNHRYLSSKIDIQYQENLAELYYQNQLGERGDFVNPYVNIGANYACIFGVDPIGLQNAISVMDGHKYACGLSHIHTKPVVYSFGSNNQQDFEMSILSYRPDSQVFTYDINHRHLPKKRDKRITYAAIGLGPRAKANDRMKLLHEIMRDNQHLYVDILKIDIEGGEYEWLKHEPVETFGRIGQLLIEVHDTQFGRSS